MTPRRLPTVGPTSDRARRHSVALAMTVIAALIVGACGTPNQTSNPPSSASANPSDGPSASVDLPALYAKIEAEVTEIRGLKAKSPVDPTVLDDAGLKKLINDSFQKDNPPALLQANQRMLELMGLLDGRDSLEKLYLELLGSQVAGLYNPDDKHLYVVSKSGGLGPAEKTTFAHEYTHALQDQNFDLSGLRLDEIGEGDRAIARLSLVEGDATLLMSLWQIQHLSQAEIVELLGQSLDPEVTGVLEKMPPVLRESLFFPYTSGLNFTQGLQTAGGWGAVDAAFADPPASTEQILHPEKYQSHERPVPVDLPNDLAEKMGKGWTVGLEDTLGEFQLKVWLANAGGGAATNQADATTAAAGWGGDRTMIVRGPNGASAVLVIATTWDTPADAAEFATQARLVVDSLHDPGSVIATGGTTVTVVIASRPEFLTQMTSVLALGA
jgi:hypothetical protein